jgi:hypothetical protein
MRRHQIFVSGGNMPDLQSKQRDEKHDEKQREKEEKYHGDPLSTAVWGAIIIWAGLVLLADNMGMLTNLGFSGIALPGLIPLRLGAWGLIFTGAAVIIFLEVAVRLLVPTYRRHVIGSIILAFVFLGIGLGNLISWGVIWALVIIAIGVLILLRGMGLKI